MEEKERYKMNDEDCLIDNEQNTIICNFCELTIFPEIVIDLLNQQDKRIKELEATNKVLSNELTKNNIIKQDRLETCCGIPIYEIPTLKQSQNQKAIECFEKFKEFCKKNESPSFSESLAGYWFLSAREVFEYIGNQIEELKGEK
jgi:hypothetical protein